MYICVCVSTDVGFLWISYMSFPQCRPSILAGHEIIAMVEKSRSHGQEVNHKLPLGCECMAIVVRSKAQTICILYIIFFLYVYVFLNIFGIYIMHLYFIFIVLIYLYTYIF